MAPTVVAVIFLGLLILCGLMTPFSGWFEKENNKINNVPAA